VVRRTWRGLRTACYASRTCFRVLLPRRAYATIHFMQKRWIIFEPHPPEYAEIVRVSPVIRQLLWHRGIRSSEEVNDFLYPKFETHVHDPFLFRNMQVAVDRIFEAFERCEKILVFGDYDADGLTGSAVIMSTIRDIHQRINGAKPLRLKSYIPHRDKEGYGLQMKQAEDFVHDGTHLVITVDCGIACVAEIERLKKGGVDVIVVDHHQFGETLPDAILIHPSVPGETYPFKFLAAVGVAWKFSCGLVQEARKRGIEMPDGYEKWLLDLVAIATVTDIVPLVGENRVLETYGLKVLNKTRRPGLRALIRQSGLVPGTISARDIGFVIGPRLNAPSRMDHAAVGLELLLANTEEEASVIASRLEALNRDRQDAMLVMMREADALLELEDHPNEAPVHVLWRDDWSPALVGLVAGRVSDRYGVPVVAIGKHGGQWIGSGRSYSYYDITEAVKRAGEDLLTRSGGHIQACGFALANDEHVPEFARRLREDAAARIAAEQVGPVLEIHAELPLEEIHWEFLEQLAALEPFGAMNVSPTFVVRGVEVMTSATVGKEGKHLRIVARSPEGRVQPFIAFGFGSRVGEVMHGNRIDIAFTVSENEWNGSKDIQCKVVDFRSTAET
jgi:single-stranded-DNA-specific exonuclease